jgi:hypothetical protein
VTPIRIRGVLCLATMTIFASSVLMATAAFAVEDSLTPNATAAVRVDMEIAALLAKVEQQISDGSIIAPYDDNAQKTWQVVEMQATTPASPGARMALSLFAEHWRNRAVNEEKAGRLAIATYLKVFSEFATDLLGRTREPSAASAPQGTTLRPFAEGLTAPGTSIESQRTARGDTRTPGALTSPPRPRGQGIVPTARLGTAKADQHIDEPAVPNAPTDIHVPDPNATRATAVDALPPAVALAVTASPLATVAPTASAQLTAEVYAKRGDDMLAIKDISAARKLYEYAVNAGSARAATALARTLDPAFITQLGAVGLKPDPTLAAAWYRKAASLGDRDAEARLHTLSTDAAK